MMKIKKLQLVNFTQITDLTVEFVNDVTVFVGDNGAGKTSLLRAAAISLSWLAIQIKRENAHGSPILDLDIKTGAKFSKVTIESHDLSIADNSFEWTLARPCQGFKGKQGKQGNELENLARLASFYRNRLHENKNGSLPLMVYYPVERVVLDLPRQFKTRKSFAQLDGYENALTQGVDLRRFVEWFYQCEEAENKAATQQILEFVHDDLEMGGREKWPPFPYDKQLMAVRNAIMTFIPDVTHIRSQRKPKLCMMVEKHGKTFEMAQLSQGEKSLMALVGDLARRLAIMNPDLENPLYGDGIVLIDEIELCLHSQWQRDFIERLRNTFPNCQFLLTTHSPVVLNNANNVQCYVLDKGFIMPVKDLSGLEVDLDINQVLAEVMETEIPDQELQAKITTLLHSTQGGDLAQAKVVLSQLETELSTHQIELAKARLLIERLESM